MRRLLSALLWLTATAAFAADPEAVPLSLSEATRRTLEKNPGLWIERENLAQAEFAVTRARGAYDLFWDADVGYRYYRDPVNSAFSGAPGDDLSPTNEGFQASTSFSQLLPTGARVSLFTDWGRATTNGVFSILSPAYTTGAGVTVRQPLLRDLFSDPAREAIRVAAADRSASEARLTRTVADTVAQVDEAYWTLVAALRDITSIQDSIALAERQLSETRSRVEAGVLGETDLAQPTAERERRKGNLALARQQAARAENRLKQLMLGDPSDPLWSAPIAPSDAPETTLEEPVLTDILATALARRPEIAEAQALRTRSEVVVDARKSDVLPRLDLVGGYARRGLAGSTNPDAISFDGGPVVVPPPLLGGTGRSLGTIGENRFPDASVGLSFSLPIQNRVARANLAIAKSGLQQSNLNITATEQQVESDVRNAFIALEAARQRIEAARAGRVAAETQLYAEQERFAVGLSTNFLVLTRQNELTTARVTETNALTDYRTASTELARAMGTLLERRQIHVTAADANAAPGDIR